MGRTPLLLEECTSPLGTRPEEVESANFDTPQIVQEAHVSSSSSSSSIDLSEDDYGGLGCQEEVSSAVVNPPYLSNLASDYDRSLSPAAHPYLRYHTGYQESFSRTSEMDRVRNIGTDYNRSSSTLSSDATPSYSDTNAPNAAFAASNPPATLSSTPSMEQGPSSLFDAQIQASRSPAFNANAVVSPSNPFFAPGSFHHAQFAAQAGAGGMQSPHYHSLPFAPVPTAPSIYHHHHALSSPPQFASALPFASVPGMQLSHPPHSQLHQHAPASSSSSTAPSPSTVSAPGSTLPSGDSMSYYSSSSPYFWPAIDQGLQSIALKTSKDASRASSTPSSDAQQDYEYARASSSDSKGGPPPVKRFARADQTSISSSSPTPHLSARSAASSRAISAVTSVSTSTDSREPTPANGKAEERSTPESDVSATSRGNYTSSSSANSSQSRHDSRPKRVTTTAASSQSARNSKKRSYSISSASSASNASPSSSPPNSARSTQKSQPDALDNSSGDIPAQNSSTPISSSSSAPPTTENSSNATPTISTTATMPNLSALDGDPVARAAVVNAINAIKKSFDAAHVVINGARTSVLSLPNESGYMRVETQPQEYQVKDFNILPTLVLRVLDPMRARHCDRVAAFLYCDEHLNLEDPFFLAALNARHAPNGELHFNNLRVSKDMLHGRTKGYSFVIGFSYITANGVTLDTVYTTPFWLFSNVNQEGFPKAARDSILRPQWRDSSAGFSQQKKKR